MVSKEVIHREARIAYDIAGRPPLCPQCGGWDGPTLPMCTDDGFSHVTTCAIYRYAPDVCAKCEDSQ